MKVQNKFTEHLHAYTLAHLNSYTHAPLHAYTRLRLHALTLIELVIVCAIIAVLVGIVWVVMAPAREKARQAVCISNLNQIGHAFRMYRDDWDGVEPEKGRLLTWWEMGLPPIHPWDHLQTYVKSKEVGICPSCALRPGGCPSGDWTYWVHYCTGEDPTLADFGIPINACPIFGSLGAAREFPFTFEKIVALVPDWPIILCDSHHYFIHPYNWHDFFFFGICLPDFSIRHFYQSEYLIKLGRALKEHFSP